MDNNSAARIKVALRVLAAYSRIGAPANIDEIHLVKIWCGDESLPDDEAAIAVINRELPRRASTTLVESSQSGLRYSA
jgi:hypothetical protein